MPLHLSVLVDNKTIFSETASKTKYSISCNITDSKHEVNHSLKFILSGKNNSHTILDKKENIVESSQIEIKNLFFDNVNVVN